MTRRIDGTEPNLREHIAAGVETGTQTVPPEAAPRPANAAEMEQAVSAFS